MKIKALLLLCPILCLPSCITLTGELSLPGSDKPGGFGGRIGGSWTWPGPKEPALPAGDGGGKTPVLVSPQ